MAESFAAQLAKASRELRAMSADVRKEIRPAIRDAAQPMVTEAKARASWSSRIPSAIRMSVARRGVDIHVSQKRAPHARPYEGITGGPTFRHPVFGRNVWVAQAVRPFLGPAVERHRGKVRAALIRIVEQAARRHGFK